MQTERAELDSGHHKFVGREIWYGFSFLIPPDFPIVDDRLVMASWKQSVVEGSPLIGQRYRNGQHSLTSRPPQALGRGKSYILPRITPGTWVDMVYRIRYMTGDDGRIEVWMNGKRVVVYEGPAVSRQGADRLYNKIGLYRDSWKEPMTIFFDNYTVGESLAAVDPARFDRPR